MPNERLPRRLLESNLKDALEELDTIRNANRRRMEEIRAEATRRHNLIMDRTHLMFQHLKSYIGTCEIDLIEFEKAINEGRMPAASEVLKRVPDIKMPNPLTDYGEDI